MCQQIIQFCSGSTKPLLFLGGAITAILAISIGYIGCNDRAFYNELDPTIGQQENSIQLTYYLQLVASGYLILITLLTCFSAHCDQKHAIRALAVVAAINFVLTAGAILVVPHGEQVLSLFDRRLMLARDNYSFTDKFPAASSLIESSTTILLPEASKARSIRQSAHESQTNATSSSNEQDRHQPADSASTLSAKNLTSNEATKLWDQLQARGCCGLRNATQEWKQDKIPKSCCSNPEENSKGEQICKAIDGFHQKPCASIIESVSMEFLCILALIALTNLYLATVSGVSTYRTFHYNEASQNAYG